MMKFTLFFSLAAMMLLCSPAQSQDCSSSTRRDSDHHPTAATHHQPSLNQQLALVYHHSAQNIAQAQLHVSKLQSQVEAEGLSLAVRKDMLIALRQARTSLQSAKHDLRQAKQAYFRELREQEVKRGSPSYRTCS